MLLPLIGVAFDVVTFDVAHVGVGRDVGVSVDDDDDESLLSGSVA